MLESYLSPLDPDDLFSSDQLPGCLANHLRVFTEEFPNLSDVNLVILGIKDIRLDGLNRGTSLAGDKCRTQLYRLMKPQTMGAVADIGNIEAGEELAETLEKIDLVLKELKSRGITAVILGGNEKLGMKQYEVLKANASNLDVVYVGKKVDLREGTLLNRLVLDEPNHLFNLTAMAYQTYLTEQQSLDAMERMFFESIRLGELRARMDNTEPLFRNSDMAIFDCSAIKQGDFPGYIDPSPNGLRSEEACQLSRYAGLSPKLSSIGFYNYNPDYDNNWHSAKQMAQMVWFFLEAFSQRKAEDPLKETDTFFKYRMGLKNEHEIVFYKSKLTDRWWMEIPHPRSPRENTIPIVVPCHYNDYLQAAEDELPDRWWRFYQKYA